LWVCLGRVAHFNRVPIVAVTIDHAVALMMRVRGPVTRSVSSARVIVRVRVTSSLEGGCRGTKCLVGPANVRSGLVVGVLVFWGGSEVVCATVMAGTRLRWRLGSHESILRGCVSCAILAVSPGRVRLGLCLGPSGVVVPVSSGKVRLGLCLGSLGPRVVCGALDRETGKVCFGKCLGSHMPETVGVVSACGGAMCMMDVSSSVMPGGVRLGWRLGSHEPERTCVLSGVACCVLVAECGVASTGVTMVCLV
jgi:hypothetical protein